MPFSDPEDFGGDDDKIFKEPLLPISADTYESWDEDSAVIWTGAYFNGDFGPWKKGDELESLTLDCSGEVAELVGSDGQKCSVRLQAFQ
jgi:hypothetical protein